MEMGDVEKAIDTIIDLAEQLALSALNEMQSNFVAVIRQNANRLVAVIHHVKPYLDGEHNQLIAKSAISHEFVTPVIAIIHYAEFLTTGVAGPSDIELLSKEQAEIASKIGQLGIQLLEWSRLWRL